MLCCARSQHAQPMSALCNGKGAVVGGDCASITKICRWWHLSACQKSFSNLENAIGRGNQENTKNNTHRIAAELRESFEWLWPMRDSRGLIFSGNPTASARASISQTHSTFAYEFLPVIFLVCRAAINYNVGTKAIGWNVNAGL